MPTIIIQPDGITGKDTWIDSQNANTNYALDEGIRIGGYLESYSYQTLIRFDLQGIAPATITKAELSLYETSFSGQMSALTYAIPITQMWEEATATWNNQPVIDIMPSHRSEFTIFGDVNHSGIVNIYDVTTAVKNDVGNGFLLKTAGDSTYSITYAASDNTVVANRPKLTITYDIPPTAPIVTSPNGGESWNSSHTVAWSESVDPEGGILTYQIDLSTNNGSTWKNIANRVSGTSYVYNFINEVETSQALIRIRAYDGTSYGPYDVSNGVFTIQHNIAPTIPTNLTPNGTIFDRTKTNLFTWRHNDSPNDAQSKADIRWRTVGATLWSNIVSNGPEQGYFFASNTLPNGQIEWQVRTYDGGGLISPWSNIAVFTSAEPTNAPVITAPTTPVNVSRPVIQWTSVSQSSYQIVIEDSLGVAVWDTGEVISTVKARTAGVDLLNGGTYKIKVRVKDGSGLFSSFNEITVTVAYTPPAKPILNAYKSVASIQLVVTNPTPVDTQPIVLGNDIYKVINDQWVRIASNVNATFTDYAVANDTEYTYFVVALGDTGTYSYSAEVTQSVAFKGAYIHDPLDAEFTVYKFKYNGIGVDTEYTPESALMKFAGRKRPVVQFGTYEDYAINITLQASRDMTPMVKLREFVANRTPVCYRDDNGEFLYGVIQALPIRKEYRVATADITIIEIDYNVEV